MKVEKGDWRLCFLELLGPNPFLVPGGWFRDVKDELRTKLLQYERSNQTWSAENILGSLSVPDPTTHTSSKPYQGPIPMELDRIYFRKGKGDQKGKGDKGKGGKGKGDKGKGKGYGGRKGGRGSKGKGRGFGRGFGKGKGKKGGKNVRQVEGKGYESGKGKGGQGVVCYNCGKTGHVASECWSAPSGKGKGKGKGGKGKCGMFRKLEKKIGALIHKQAHQRSRKQEQHQQQKENEQVRRLVTTPMPIIEEVDDEDYVDLIGMFEDLAHDWSVRAVKMTESKKLVKVANMADGSDEEEYERDELHK